MKHHRWFLRQVACKPHFEKPWTIQTKEQRTHLRPWFQIKTVIVFYVSVSMNSIQWDIAEGFVRPFPDLATTLPPLCSFCSNLETTYWRWRYYKVGRAWIPERLHVMMSFSLMITLDYNRGKQEIIQDEELFVIVASIITQQTHTIFHHECSLCCLFHPLP